LIRIVRLTSHTPEEKTAVRSKSECSTIVLESGDARAEKQIVY